MHLWAAMLVSPGGIPTLYGLQRKKGHRVWVHQHSKQHRIQEARLCSYCARRDPSSPPSLSAHFLHRPLTGPVLGTRDPGTLETPPLPPGVGCGEGIVRQVCCLEDHSNQVKL